MAEGPPTRDFIGPYGCGLHPNGPGARKEKARARTFERPPVSARRARPYAELRFDDPFDLVVCSDVLHYVPTREVLRGLSCLDELVGGVAYLDFLTADDDLETGIEGDTAGFRMRRAAWYRRKLRATGLVECGLGFWAAPELAPQLTALERMPGK